MGNAPLGSPVPLLRPDGAGEAPRRAAVASAQELVAAARLDGQVGFVVAEARTGRVLEAMQPDLPLPPASVNKAITALYALESLGPEHRFVTRLVATGPIRDGRIEGDLVLLGGGDPGLSSDDLGDMGAQLKERGVRAIAGRFLVHGSALPAMERIASDQPVQVSYNPALSGLNLNYNRVHFQWSRSGQGYEVVMDAPAQRYRPAVSIARMSVVDRSLPVYTYSNSDATESWTVASRALGNEGSRWLPVRHPDLYAGDVFRTIAAYHGITLPAAERAPAQEMRGGGLVEHRSPPLREIVEGMLRYSTNVTAEVLGIAAAQARDLRPRSLAASGRMMGEWAEARFGMRDSELRDHSGLSDGSRLSAADMVRFLVGARVDGALHPLLREHRLLDGNGNLLANPPAEVVAKTGTLNFVSGLGGYIIPPDGPELAFAFFAADMSSRDAIPPEERERPPGARYWAGRARNLQQRLIGRWLQVHA